MSLLSPFWGIRLYPRHPCLNIDASAALQKLSITGFAFKLTFINHDPAAREHGLDHSLDLLAFVRVVINVHVTAVHTQRLLFFRIEDNDISIRADSDRSFLRKQPKHFCGSR